MQRTSFLPLVPAAIGAVLLASQCIALLAMSGSQIFFGWQLWRDHRLVGVTITPTQQFTWDRFLHGHWQREVSETIGRKTPLFEHAVRLKNQALYSIFDTSGTPSVVIGRDRQLYGWSYVSEYCTRDVDQLLLRAEKAVQKIKDIQDYYVAKQKGFLYLVTPSKAAVYPEHLPAGLTCPASDTARKNFLTAYHNILDRYHIRYVDTASLMATARLSLDFPLFPRGGVHWNSLGASLATQAIVNTVKREYPFVTIASFSWSLRMSQNPRGSDRDLLDLLNLEWPDLKYEVPQVRYSPSASTVSCQTLRIAAVGGSFMQQIAEILARTNCRSEIQIWEYWKAYHVVWTERGVQRTQNVNELERNRFLAEEADIILLEENEEVLASTNHVILFHSLLYKHSTSGF